jgi:5-formyltetrahydrofolate cyclo-ligase
MPMSDAKRVLRAQMRAGRNDFASTCDTVIAPPPAFLDHLSPGVVIASYIPTGSEADPTPLAAAARAAGCILALPYVTSRTEPIAFKLWDEDAPLSDGPFGLRQPAADAPDAAPSIILTPLLAFDDAFNRLGQGAGHYDRAFAANPYAWRLGVAWSCQRVEALDTDAWDVPLHAIVTEDGMVS